MLKKSQLTLAISSALGLYALGSPAAFAEDQAEKEIAEEIVVTGSNIPRAISDAPQPITVIDALDIKLSGITSTSDLLRQTAYNSFGSFRERSGSSFGQIATVDLRGLGADRTAVLVNGRRIPGSPLTGASIVDLNTIPVSAIERLEILKDSANAIYGADAIGGVISITLKKDFDGFSFGGGLEMPTREGADSESFNVLWGSSFDRGHIMIGAEYFSKDAISDADRAYSRADATGPDFNNTEGVSVGGNTAFETDFTNPFALGDCDTSLYAGVFVNPFGLGGDGCGFAYANISLQTGNLERKSIFLNASYELTENAELNFDIRHANNQTSGRYAPAVGFFLFPAESPFNTLDSDLSNDDDGVVDTLGRDVDVFHRFVGHGNRVDSSDYDETVISLSLKGEFGEGIGYNVWSQYYDNSGAELGNTYVRASVLEAQVLAGNYNVFDPLSQDPIHLEAVERSGIQLSRDLKTENVSLGVTFNGESFEMAGGTSGWAAGVEWADEDYTDIYDEFREAIDVLGSAGNSAQGGRTRYAAFGEFRLPVTDTIEVNVASRYDHYDDFGSEFSPQISSRWTVNDNLVLRASWGEGFKAPNLVELHQELAESFDDITDQLRCAAQGEAPADCQPFQVQNFSGGNLNLEAEESENFNIGAVFDFGGVSASLDYYTVDLNNAVTELSLDQINDREGRGDLPPDVIVNRGPTVDGVLGAIIDIHNPLTNGASVKTSGLDLGINYKFDIDAGAIDLNLSWVHILKYDEQTTLDSPVDELIGTENGDTAYPENRLTSSVRYSNDSLTLAFNSQLIDSFRNVSDTDDYATFVSHDITANWTNVFDVEGLNVSGGVRNILDRGPSIDPTAGYSDSVVLETYPVDGRVAFLNFTYTIGE